MLYSKDLCGTRSIDDEGENYMQESQDSSYQYSYNNNVINNDIERFVKKGHANSMIKPPSNFINENQMNQ